MILSSSGDRLTIDITAANGGKDGAVAADGNPPLDHSFQESDVLDEEPDELEVDLDTPWVKPSVEHARNAGKVRSELSAQWSSKNNGLLSGSIDIRLLNGVPFGSMVNYSFAV